MRRSLPRLGWIVALLTAGSAALAVDRSWNNPLGGAYNSTLNWSTNIVPQAGDNGVFNLFTAGYGVSFSAGTTSGGMIVRNDVVNLNLSGFTLTLSGATGVALADQANNAARLTISGGTLATAGGTLGGGTNSLGNGTVTSGGTLTCSGPLTIGGIGLGQLSMLGGGRLTTSSTVTIGSSSLGAGTLSLNGVGSNWVSSAGSVIVGADGIGNLTLSNSGTMSSAGIVLGAGAGSGVMTITGSTASATFTGSSVIGGAGSGRLTTSGSVSGTSFTLGDSATGVGTLSVSVLGSLTASGALVVGNAGTGVASFTSNVSSTAGVTVGSGTGSNGTMTIVGAIVNNTGSVVVGSSGAGTVAINPGGNLSSGSAIIGRNAGGTGIVNFSGGGWTNTGTVTIGGAGSGLVSVAAGGDLAGVGIRLGESAGGSGILNVIGAGSEVTGSGSLVVGESGAGTMSVSSAADVSSAGTTIGRLVGGVGLATVQGTGSTWTNSGSLTVGGSGTGVLNLGSGGSIATDSTNIGNDLGSIGTLALAGGASQFISNGGLFVGGGSLVTGGSGCVSVGSGAALSVGAASVTRIYGTGSVNLDGGTIFTGSLDVQAGGALNFNSGSLIVTGLAGMNITAPSTLGASVTIGSGKALTVFNTGTIGAAAIVNMTGGALNAGLIENHGELLLSDRASLVSAGAVINHGLISGDGRISGTVANMPGGEIRADSGDRVSFINGLGSSNNSGRINLLGGTVEYDQLTNNSDGRITGRGVLSTSGGIANNGTATFSAGTADVLGDLTNNSGAKTIVTGGSTSTFFDDVTNNPGSEFRVSTASTAVFLGTVTGLSQFTGPGTKDFEGPTSFGGLDTTGTTIVGPAATLNATHVREKALFVEGVATIAPDGTANATSNVKSLTLEGGATPTGTLDLNNNALVVDYTAPDPSPIQTIRAQIAHAFHGGAWDRPGITSSLADSAARGLGYAEASALSSIPAIFGAVDATAVLVRLTRFGDADLNGAVNLQDFNRLAADFGGVGKVWSEGDFNYDTLVNLADFNLLAGNFGMSVGPAGPTPQDWANLASAVPEPAGQFLLLTSIFIVFSSSIRGLCYNRQVHRSTHAIDDRSIGSF